MFQQLVDQFFARVVFRGVRVQLRIARQQHLALNVDQRRRHVHEVRTQLNIQRRRLFHVLQVLRGDLRDRNVLYVDFLLPNEVQKQIQRAFVLFKMEV